MMTIALAAGLAAFGLSGCKNKKNPPAANNPGSAEVAGSGSAGSAMAGSAAGSAEGSGSAAMAGSGSSAAVDVPTEEDFEAQAQTDVTDKNLSTKVKALEAEMGK
jgi:hypothetical protein